MGRLLCFVQRDVTDGPVQARVVIPVDPFQRLPFDLTNGLPKAEKDSVPPDRVIPPTFGKARI